MYYRLLYRPQLAVDGNMKLVHLKMRCPEDDVSLSDGNLFVVTRAPYTESFGRNGQGGMCLCKAWRICPTLYGWFSKGGTVG